MQRLFHSGAIQAKLRVSQPNDLYEQEADRVAEQVMRMPDSNVTSILQGPEMIQRKCEPRASSHSLCPECEEEEEKIPRQPLANTITPLIQRQSEEDEFLQTKKKHEETPEVTPRIAANIHSLKGGGQPLTDSSRSFLERRFGYGFGHVRVHSDTRAAETARSLNARAFTVGKNVAFAAGQYDPRSTEGRELLAHELTHVVHQTSSDSSSRISRAPDSVIQRDDYEPSTETTLEEAPMCIEPQGEMCEAPPTPQTWEPPEPGDETIVFEDRTLSTSAPYIRYQMAQIIAEKGMIGTEYYIKRLQDTLGGERWVATGRERGQIAEKITVAPYGPAATEEGRQLVEQILPVMRSELAYLRKKLREFSSLVRNAAIVRLKTNKVMLSEWSAYVESLAPKNVMGQVLATQEFDLFMARHTQPQSLAYSPRGVV